MLENNQQTLFRMNYYAKLLSNCETDAIFQCMLSTVRFKEVVQLPKNNSMYRFVIKCNHNDSNLVVAPVDTNESIENYLHSLSIPMYHYHLSKNNYVQDNFVYRITDNETGAIAKFIERLRLIDIHIKNLIADYIKKSDVTSPILKLINRNKGWNYVGIINKSNDTEYLNIRYFKNFNKEASSINNFSNCLFVFS